KSSATTSALSAATSSGRRAFNAATSRSAPMRPRSWKLTTCPSACAPASVRPAAETTWSSPVSSRSARFSSASTVRPLACCCQPAKPLPSYASTTLIFTCQRAADLIDELDQHHGGRVALARPLADDPRVAARPLGQPRHEVGEKPLHDLRLGHLAADAAARRDVLALRLGDEPLDPPPQLLGLCLSRGDAAALEQRRAEVAHQRLPLIRRAVEVAAALLVTHRTGLAPKDRPHLLGLDEALLDQLLLDLVQRLAAEVPQRQQLLFLLLEQLPDGLDLVRLQAVERADRQVELLDRSVHEPVLRALLTAPLGLLLLDGVVEVDEEAQVLGEERRRGAHGLL